MKDYSKMSWDSNEAFTKEIAKAFFATAIYPLDLFDIAKKSIFKDSIETYFWKHYFGYDFQLPTPPEYLFEISSLDRETRRIFSIIAFILLDKTMLERLIDSEINQLKGRVRIDGLNIHIAKRIRRMESDDSFKYLKYETGEAVEFNFKKVLTYPLFGKCLMNLLNSRLRYSLNSSQKVPFDDLMEACFELKFHEALGLTKTFFKLWLKGITGGMLWDSNEAFTKNIAKVFFTAAVYPLDLFDKAWKSYPEQSIETDFWQHYFGIDFHTPAPPDYLSEINSLYRETRRIFSIIAFILLDKTMLERLIDSEIDQLKGRVRIDGLNNFIAKMIRQTESDDSFKYLKYETGEAVEFNFKKVLTYPMFGKCLMNLLNSRLKYGLFESGEVSSNKLMEVCNELKFHEALGLTKTAFKQWLEGANIFTGEYISETTISNFICVENASLEFSNPNSEISKEIYLLGENGDGKTLILEALLMTYAKERIKENAPEMGYAYKLYDEVKRKGATLKGTDNEKIEFGNNHHSYLPQIFAYGTHRGRISSDTASSFDDFGFLTLFDTNKTLTDPSEWIKDFCTKGLGSIDSLSFEEYQSNNKVALNRLAELQDLFDIILNKRIKIKIEKDNSVKYVEHGAELTFDQLSEGYRSTLIFICDLLYRLFKSQSENEEEEEEAIEHGRNAKAVVLIDEIDAHLHPRWQREIVKKMRKLFPNVQFIMTTHSPFIIQGASDDALIFRLFRENGKTCVSEPIKRSELDYMMINTLATSPIFGMGSARLSNNDNINYTSNSYLMERIEKTILEKIRNDKSRNYLSEKEIDEMISETWEQIDSENQ